MPTILAAPAELDLQIVQGEPFALQISVTATDAAGTVPWSSFSSPISYVAESSATPSLPPYLLPTITEPHSGEWVLSWSAEQTAEFTEPTSWYFGCDLLSTTATPTPTGPWYLLTGTITPASPTEPGTATSSSTTLTVDVGGITVTMVIAPTGA